MAGNAKTLTVLMAGCLVWGASGGAFAQQALPSVDELVNKLSPRAAPDSARGAAPGQVSKKKFTRGLVMSEDAEEKPTGGGTPPTGTPMVAAPAAAPTPAPTTAPSGAMNPPPLVAASPERPAQAAAAPSPPAPAAATNNVYSESRITFEFGSDQLTPYAKRVLDVFGAAIQHPKLQGTQFIVEGHTDGVGSDQYNLDLSRKRAESVIRYLVDNLRVNPDRLAGRGKGRRDLLNPNDPGSPDNRRVVWISH